MLLKMKILILGWMLKLLCFVAIRQISGSECRDMIMPGFKSSGNDSCELRNLKVISIFKSL